MTHKGQAKKSLTELRSNFDSYFVFAMIDDKPMVIMYQGDKGQIEDMIFSVFKESTELFEMFDAILTEVEESEEDYLLN